MIGDLAGLERALAARTNYERTAPPPGGFGLHTIRALCAELDDPQRHPRIVHVAGTTGKGTTCAAIAGALDAEGLRVGLYTSPHLVDLRERIRIGPAPAPDAAWLAAGREVLAAAERVAPHATWFELVTAIAFVVFRDADLDAWVLEVGLGGRLDATNVADARVAVIARIARDHTALLGDDEGPIAREKAGIIVPGAPVVAGPGHPAAIAAIEARAAELGAPLWLLDRELTMARDGARLVVRTPVGEQALDAPSSPARAACLALAVGALHRLEHSGRHAARARWPGRFQRVPGDPEWILDGAHDPVSTAALLATLRPDERPVLLFGAAADKDLPALAAALGPRCAEVFCCPIPSPRSADPGRLTALFAPHAAARVGDLSAAEACAREQGQPLLIAGSLYLVGEAMRGRGLNTLQLW